MDAYGDALATDDTDGDRLVLTLGDSRAVGRGDGDSLRTTDSVCDALAEGAEEVDGGDDASGESVAAAEAEAAAL